jgi:site-specific recombinase XerD
MLNGISPDMIRELLGHVDVKTIQIYAGANLEMERNALFGHKVYTAESDRAKSNKWN